MLMHSLNNTLVSTDFIKKQSNPVIPPQPAPFGSIRLDDFNRANGSLHQNNIWNDTDFGLGNYPQILNNQINFSSILGANVDAYWNPSKFGPDCFVYIDLIANNTSGGMNYFFFSIRLNGTGSGRGGYVVLFGLNSNAATVFRLDGESTPQINGSISVTITPGDSYGVSAIGNDISIWRKPSGGIWEEQGHVTDSTHTLEGYVSFGGWEATEHNFIFDNFGAMTIGEYAFPLSSTTLIDNFNRSGPTLGSNWSSLWSGWNDLAISGNKVVPSTGGIGAAYLNSQTFNSDQEAYITVTNLGINGPNEATSIILRINNPNTDNVTFYEFSINHDTICKIVRADSSTDYTTIKEIGIPWFTNGGKIGARVTGSKLEMFVDHDGSSGFVKILEVEDNTYSTGSYVGISIYDGAYDSGLEMDDFAAGSFEV